MARFRRATPPGQNYDFSNGYETVNGVIVADGNGKSIFPTHEASGLPLTVLAIDAPQGESETWKDHDHRGYPKNCEQLRGGAGLALRRSSVHDTERWLHTRKHIVFPEGPKLPATPEEKYRPVVLNTLGYVPRQAVDLTNTFDYAIVELSDRKVDDLIESGTIHIDTSDRPREDRQYRQTISRFLVQQAVAQGMTNVSRSLVDELLVTTDPQRKMELGHVLLTDTPDAPVGSIQQVHQDLCHQGLVCLTR